MELISTIASFSCKYIFDFIVFPLMGALVQRDNNFFSSRSSITGVYTWRRVNRFPSTTLYACYMCFCTACNCSYWEFVFMSKPCFYLSVRRWRKLLNKLIAEMISCCQEQTAREGEYGRIRKQKTLNKDRVFKRNWISHLLEKFKRKII